MDEAAQQFHDSRLASRLLDLVGTELLKSPVRPCRSESIQARVKACERLSERSVVGSSQRVNGDLVP